MSYTEDKVAWDSLVAIDQKRTSEIFGLWAQVENKIDALEQALRVPRERRAALRLLLSEANETKQLVFETLVDLASIGHSDIDLCRTVIKSMPRRWVLDNIEAIANTILSNAEDEEEFRRLAELYREMDATDLLYGLIQIANQSSNSDVREVAEDFALTNKP